MPKFPGFPGSLVLKSHSFNAHSWPGHRAGCCEVQGPVLARELAHCLNTYTFYLLPEPSPSFSVDSGTEGQAG